MILNKVDLVSSDEVLEDLEKDIRAINSLANIIRSVRCQVDFSMILNCRAYDATVSFFVLLLHMSAFKGNKIKYRIFLLISACHSFGRPIERKSNSIYQ